QGERRRNSRRYCNDERRGNAGGKARSPDLKKSFVGLAPRRADRFVAFLAIGPSGASASPLLA
ncbi:hypothetical protein, partial [Burkholderia stagnalis]|uniref:hypothetical protein n=1 Tax=Burkholderia stagnalis TaxID=1503054 RepID=UPI001C88EC09